MPNHFDQSARIVFEHPIIAIAGLICFLILTRKGKDSYFGYSTTAFFSFNTDFKQRLIGVAPKIIFYLVVLGLFVSLSQPKIKMSHKYEKILSRDIVLAMDMSGSMTTFLSDPGFINAVNPPQAEMLKSKKKIDLAKEAAIYFVTMRQEDRFALMVFSDDTFGIWPLSIDHTIIEQKIRLLGILDDGGYEFIGGTDLIKSISSSITYINKASNAPEPILIYISDGEGEALDSEIIEQAMRLTQKKVHFYWILMGNEEKTKESPIEKLLQVIPYGKKYIVYNKDELYEAVQDISKIEKGETLVELVGQEHELYPYLCIFSSILIMGYLWIKGYEI